LAHGTPVPSRAQTNPVAFAAENPKAAVASGETLAGVEIHAIAPTATGVVVTPPDQTTALLRPWSFGPVCQHGLIQQNAYVAGSAPF